MINSVKAGHKCISLYVGLGKSAQKTVSSWQLYFQQPVLPASLAFIMLHFNAVLSPGCLMTAFLSSRGLSGTAAAIFRLANFLRQIQVYTHLTVIN